MFLYWTTKIYCESENRSHVKETAGKRPIMEWKQHNLQGQDGADDPARAIDRGKEETDYGKTAGAPPTT